MSAFELPRRAKVGAMAAEIRRLERENAALREALQNAKGLLHTPIARQKYRGDEFYSDVVASILAVLPAEPLEGETPDLIGGSGE